MPLDCGEIVEAYRRRAARHDFTANLYYLFRFRLGPIGAAVSPRMLSQARLRIEREGWRNVDVVSCDAAHARPDTNRPKHWAGIAAQHRWIQNLRSGTKAA
jgi:hypothetical protein